MLAAGMLAAGMLAAGMLAAGMLAAGAVGGCHSEPLPERQPVEYEDFGTEVYRMLHREARIADNHPQAKMAVLEQNRDDLIWALNRMVDEPVYGELQGALEAILPHYDYTLTDTPCTRDEQCTGEREYCLLAEGVCAAAGPIPRLSRRLNEILSRMDQPQFDALAKITASHGAPPDALNRLLYRVLAYDQELLGPLHALVMDQEPALTEILRWGHREIQELPDSPPVSHPTFAEKLLVEVDSGLDTGAPAWAILLDDNGNPVVNTEGGEPLPPYQDTDGDGLVDTDPNNDPVDDQGYPILMPVFSDESHRGEDRDADGRAIAPSQPYFQYFDVKKTLLGATLWNLHPMMKDGVIWDLFTAFEGLLGPKVNRADADGDYPGFDGASNPLLDLMHALREIRRYERLPQLMRVLEALVQNHPLLLEQLLTELGKTIAIFEGTDRLTEGNTLFDDLHVELEYLTRTGLFKELLLAFLDPRIEVLPQGMLNMLVYTDIDVEDPPNDLDCGTVSACQDRIQEIYGLGYRGMTDWSQPGDTRENQSIQQKFLALVWDTYEVRHVINLFNWLPLDSMVVTEDMATYYAEAMAGVAELSAAGIDGSVVVPFIPEFEDKWVSAEELGLFMNHDHSVLGNAVCKQGHDVKDHLGRYLLALQTTGALEGCKPIAEGFANLDDVHAFTRLLTVLHFHYGSTPVDDPAGITTQHGTNFRAIEQPLARTLSETQLAPRAIELVRALVALEVQHQGETLDPLDELDRFVTYLFDTSSSTPLSTYGGQTWILGGDGERRIESMSRMYLLLHAFDRMDAMLEANPTAKQAWDRLDLLGYFLDVDPSTGELENPTTVPLLIHLVPILADELTERFADPDYLTDLDEELEDLEDFFSSRGFSYLYDVMLVIRDDPAHAALKALLDDLLVEATDASRGGDPDLFGALLAVLSDLIQSRIDVNAGKQILRWFGTVIEPDDRTLFELVELVATLYDEDPDRIFVELLKNLFREHRPGRFPINVLGRVIKHLNRLDPTALGPYSAADFEHILTNLNDYLLDDERGLERMYHIINHAD